MERKGRKGSRRYLGMKCVEMSVAQRCARGATSEKVRNFAVSRVQSDENGRWSHARSTISQRSRNLWENGRGGFVDEMAMYGL